MEPKYAIADRHGTLVTREHSTALAAWRELIPDLPDDPDHARRATLAWVGRGYRVMDRAQGT